MHIKEHNKYNNEIKLIWDDIYEHSYCTIFQSYRWNEIWYNSIGKNKINSSILILEVIDNKKTVAIFPLFKNKINRITNINFMGGLQTDYLLPIIIKNYFDENNINLIWKLVFNYLKKFDLIFLEKIPAFIDLKKNIFPTFLKKYSIINSHQVCINTNYDNFIMNLSKKLTYDNNRNIKRLNKLGNLEFKNSDSIVENLDIINFMINNKSFRYKMTNAWDMFGSEFNINFYKNLKDFKTNQGKIHCSSLLLNGKIIACHVGLINLNNFYYMMPAFNYQIYNKYSPGKILLLFLLKWSFDNDYKIFDFTGGNEKYKYLWKNNSFPLYNLIYANTFFGKIILLVEFSKPLIKKIPFLNKIILFIYRRFIK